MVDGQVAADDSRASQPLRGAHCDANESVFFRHAPVAGGHEVIVEAPFHAASLTEVPDAIVRLAFEAYRRRLLHWGREPGMQYGVVFKNVGSDAGASLLHSHSQLLAMQFTPPEIVRLLNRLDQYRQQHDVCYFCDMWQAEREAGTRVIAETDTMVAFCPYAGRTPYLIWVLPKRHQSRFEKLEMDELSDVALLTKRLLRCVEAVCPNAAYNYVIHTQPFHADCESICHWHMEIFPRLIKIAGFEWGTDCFINPVLTELAAAELRTAYAAANAVR
jgi:UDPglucose--hexose-1-phosphate uridylyltransferase